MAVLRILLAGTALLTMAWAQQPVAFTEWPQSVTSGQPSTLKWAGGNDGPVTITLRKGPATDLQDVEVLTDNAQNGEFKWTPTTDLADGSDYAFQISQDGQVNYSGQIQVAGGSGSAVNSPPAPTQGPEATTTPDEIQKAQFSSQAASAMRTNAPMIGSSSAASSRMMATPSSSMVPSTSAHATRSSMHREVLKTSKGTVIPTHTFAAPTPTETSMSRYVPTGSASQLTGSAIFGVGAAFFMLFL